MIVRSSPHWTTIYERGTHMRRRGSQSQAYDMTIDQRRARTSGNLKREFWVNETALVANREGIREICLAGG
jgi:hypothetical protein